MDFRTDTFLQNICGPASIHVDSTEVDAAVSNDDAIWVEHRHDMNLSHGKQSFNRALVLRIENSSQEAFAQE